jgi:hypothetical protein
MGDDRCGQLARRRQGKRQGGEERCCGGDEGTGSAQNRLAACRMDGEGDRSETEIVGGIGEKAFDVTGIHGVSFLCGRQYGAACFDDKIESERRRLK